jgi:hypothetical protein
MARRTPGHRQLCTLAALRLALVLLAVVAAQFAASQDHAAEQQCGGLAPQLSLLFAADYDTANHVCCHNTHYAEFRGYASAVDFYDELERRQQSALGSTEVQPATIFYDSVCGIPLFRAPVGRTFAEWREESEHHGWPSFRSEEMYEENVIIKPGGEMVSTCGVHLGHNLPDS